MTRYKKASEINLLNFFGPIPYFSSSTGVGRELIRCQGSKCALFTSWKGSSDVKKS